jgi:6-phosphogluconate dehydrogenase
MRDGAGMAPAEIGNVFDRWNKGRLNSYLIEITAKVLGVTDEKSGGPIVDIIVDRAGQKGTGRWSAIESQSLGIPATAIEAAVAARSLSAMKDLRIEAEKRFKIETGSVEPLDDHRITMLEDALLAGKVIAYAQGFAVMTAASKEFGWDLPLAEVARIWRAGCIIRSQFLDEIASAYEAETEKTDLLMTDTFADLISRTQGALRKTVAESAAAGLPVPALASALGHFDQFRLGRGTANLIQAQRDFFGAHSFERFDAPGAHHGNWS